MVDDETMALIDEAKADASSTAARRSRARSRTRTATSRLRRGRAAHLRRGRDDGLLRRGRHRQDRLIDGHADHSVHLDRGRRPRRRAPARRRGRARVLRRTAADARRRSATGCPWSMRPGYGDALVARDRGTSASTEQVDQVVSRTRSSVGATGVVLVGVSGGATLGAARRPSATPAVAASARAPRAAGRLAGARARTRPSGRSSAARRRPPSRRRAPVAVVRGGDGRAPPGRRLGDRRPGRRGRPGGSVAGRDRRVRGLRPQRDELRQLGAVPVLITVGERSGPDAPRGRRTCCAASLRADGRRGARCRQLPSRSTHPDAFADARPAGSPAPSERRCRDRRTSRAPSPTPGPTTAASPGRTSPWSLAGWDATWWQRCRRPELVVERSAGSPPRSTMSSAVDDACGSWSAASPTDRRAPAGGALPTLPVPPRSPPPASTASTAAPLDAVLRGRRRTHLLVAGLGLEAAVHSTLRTANDRGYECLLVTDACAPLDPRPRCRRGHTVDHVRRHLRCHRHHRPPSSPPSPAHPLSRPGTP